MNLRRVALLLVTAFLLAYATDAMCDEDHGADFGQEGGPCMVPVTDRSAAAQCAPQADALPETSPSHQRPLVLNCLAENDAGGTKQRCALRDFFAGLSPPLVG